MAIYDSNWISYALYVTGTVESSLDYGCIEAGAFAGIGIAQWSYDRSWQLLNMLVTDYPNMESYFPSLYSSIAPGTSSWGNKTFSQSEANEISAALVTDEGVATQKKLWVQDCTETYIPLLRDQCSITNTKTAIFALTCYHQSPRRFYEIFNSVGNCDLETWYYGTLNNSVLGKYTTRQKTVYTMLLDWDGESGAEGFGTTIPTETTGGDQNQNSLNLSEIYGIDISLSYINKVGKNLFLYLTDGNKTTILEFLQSTDRLWYGKSQSSKVNEQTYPTGGVSGTTGGTDEQRQALVDLITSFVGQCAYSQAQDKRMNPPGGYCDCSGLTWYCYNTVCSINVGTWTGDQWNSGTRVLEGSGVMDTSGLLPGDLCVYSETSANSGHVEMYIGNNQLCGHGGDPYYGPTIKNNADTYATYANHWVVNRYI